MKTNKSPAAVFCGWWLSLSLILAYRVPAAPVFNQNSGKSTHPYFPLTAGAVFTFAGYGDAAGIPVVFRVIGVETADGVRCMKFTSKRANDYLQTFWIAQDTEGNLWQLRKHDAHPLGGYKETDYPYLSANLEPGGIVTIQRDDYTVVSLSARVETPYRTFSNCVHLRLEEFGDVEEDFLAPGVGLIKISFAGSENGGWRLASVSGFTPPAQDVTRPTVTISYPPANGRVSNAVVQIRGKAVDSGGLSAVWCRVNESAWTQPTSTNGWRDWSLTHAVMPGTNWIRAYSVDTADNVSLTNVVKFKYVLTAPLTLVVEAGGKVAGATNRQILEIGATYRVTATANPRFFFEGWSGDLVSTNPVLAFQMRSNLMLQANFVTNKFLAIKGTYNGLFFPGTSGGTKPLPNEIQATNAGYVTLTLADQGTFSGTLRLGGKSHSFSGRANLAGAAHVTVSRAPSTPLTLDLSFDLDHGTDEIRGSVGAGSWRAGVRAVRTALPGLGMFAGNYTFLIPGAPAEQAGTRPAGDGAGTLKVVSTGAVTLGGSLGDGEPVTQSSALSKSGECPLHVSLSGGKGVVLGWIKFSTNTPPFGVSGDSLSWVKRAGASTPYYPLGFAESKELMGARYVTPKAGFNVLGWTNGVVLIDGGNLTATLSNQVRVVRNVVTVFGTNNVRISLVPATGLFSGSFTHSVTRKTVAVAGALLQLPAPDAGFGGGWFKGTNETGYIRLVPE